ncbi:MAG: hypothetical protein ACI8Q1_003220 [Parvicella sp.]|jgi:hypothetical protein
MDSDQKKRVYNFHVPNDWDVKEFVEAGIIVIDGATTQVKEIFQEMDIACS